jgi:DNA-binding response OmpR family regulator
MTTHRILLAEDDGDLRIILAETLREQGHQVREVADGNRLAEALGAILVGGPLAFDLVVADLHMPGWSALGLLDVLRSRPGCPPFILMSGFGDDADRGQARRLGALGLLEKPFSPRALLAMVDASGVAWLRHAQPIAGGPEPFQGSGMIDSEERSS